MESGECGDALFIYIKLLLSCEMYSRFLFSPDRLLIYAQSEMRHVSSDPVEKLYIGKGKLRLAENTAANMNWPLHWHRL